MHLPGVRLAAPLLTDHDVAGLHFAASNKVDIVMVPFVRGSEDVQLVRKMLDDFRGEDVQVGMGTCKHAFAAAELVCSACATVAGSTMAWTVAALLSDAFLGCCHAC